MTIVTINRFHKEYYERLRNEVQKAKTKAQMNDVLGEVYVMLNTFLNNPIDEKESAAPDLLSALQGMLEVFADDSGDFEDMATVIAARAAIKKAGAVCKETPMHKIIIVMEGGLIQDVSGVPSGIALEVRYFGEDDINERPEAVEIDGELCDVHRYDYSNT